MSISRVCQVENCQREHEAKGYCNVHYMRFRRSGDVKAHRPPREQHRLRASREYGIWSAMRERCYNPKRRCYEYYGGRGIKVCDAWRYSFTTFYRDMGPSPTSLHSINRIDNDSDYEPGNCEWVTQHEQEINKGPRKGSRSGYKGIALDSKVDKWAVRITHLGKTYTFGYYRDPPEAAYIYDQVALQIHGDRTYRNFL